MRVLDPQTEVNSRNVPENRGTTPQQLGEKPMPRVQDPQLSTYAIPEVGANQIDLSVLETAVAFARGIEGLMLPLPELAEPAHAWALLRLAACLGDRG